MYFIPHQFSFTLGSLTQLKVDELSLLHIFYSFSIFLHGREVYFGLLSVCAAGIHVFGVCWGRIFSRNAQECLLKSFLVPRVFFPILPIHFWLQTYFWLCLVAGKIDPRIGGLQRSFFLCEAISRFMKQLSHLGHFSPISIFDFGSQDVFVHTWNLYLAVKFILVLAWLSKSNESIY